MTGGITFPYFTGNTQATNVLTSEEFMAVVQRMFDQNTRNPAPPFQTSPAMARRLTARSRHINALYRLGLQPGSPKARKVKAVYR